MRKNKLQATFLKEKVCEIRCKPDYSEVQRIYCHRFRDL